MAHLNHFHNQKLLTYWVGSLLLLTSISSKLQADVLQIFDPTVSNTNNKLYFSFNGFIGNDPVSLEEWFDDWSKEYHPRSGKNIALDDLRFDIGVQLNNQLYIGYFYTHQAIIKTNRDFTDFFYNTKNKYDLPLNKRYYPDLTILGVEQQGILANRTFDLWKKEEHHIKLGLGVYLSSGINMQDGHIYGEIQSIAEKDYELSSTANYHYTHNYLYDLSVRKATGLGYGLHIGIVYSSKDHDFTLKAITNDLWARVYWKDLPYSIVNMETKNKEYDENGYVRYNPSISGMENYRDYTQHIPTRSLVEVSKKVGKNRYDGGFTYAYNEYFPYLKLSHLDQEDRVITVSYAHRFKTFGLAYGWQNFHIGIEIDQLVNNSTLGLSTQFSYNF